MGNRLTQSISTVTILLFLVSLTPLTISSTVEEQGLRSVISQIQQLQSTPEKLSIDFRIVFSNAITTLRSAAGLNKNIAEEPVSSNAEKSQIIISVRLPYLLPPDLVSHIEGKVSKLPLSTWELLYQSHITCPELPPPIICAS